MGDRKMEDHQTLSLDGGNEDCINDLKRHYGHSKALSCKDDGRIKGTV